MKENQNNKLIRRNLKTSKGKKRWRRNIIADDVLQDVAENKKQQQLQKSVKKKIKKAKLNELFAIDTQGSAGTSKPEKLDKNRFKKKEVIKKSIGEIKKIKKIKQQKNESQQQQKKIVKKNSEEIFDIWEENKQQSNIKKPVLGPLDKKPKTKAVVIPDAGQSLNPLFKQHEKLLTKIVNEQTKEKVKVVNDKSKKILKKQKAKKKNLKVRQMEREEEKKKQERQQQHQFFELKKYKKELKETQQKSLEKQKKIQEFNEEKEKLKQEKGIVKNKDYQMKVPDFQLPSQIKGKLRYAQNIDEGKSLMREQFDNYFRRGLIGLAKGKFKKRRIPKYKYHTTDREHANLNEAHALGDMEN